VQTFLPASHVEQEESRMIDGKKAYLVKYEMKVGELVAQSTESADGADDN